MILTRKKKGCHPYYATKTYEKNFNTSSITFTRVPRSIELAYWPPFLMNPWSLNSIFTKMRTSCNKAVQVSLFSKEYWEHCQRIVGRWYYLPQYQCLFLLVLFVKKHDGSCRMCIKYQALNEITVKDKFPNSHDQWILRWISRDTIFHKIKLTARLLSSQSTPKRCRENCIWNTWRPLQNLDNAI